MVQRPEAASANAPECRKVAPRSDARQGLASMQRESLDAVAANTASLGAGGQPLQQRGGIGQHAQFDLDAGWAPCTAARRPLLLLAPHSSLGEPVRVSAPNAVMLQWRQFRRAGWLELMNARECKGVQVSLHCMRRHATAIETRCCSKGLALAHENCAHAQSRNLRSLFDA